MSNLFLKIFLLISVLIQELNCDCSMMQVCPEGKEDDPSCQPEGATDEYTKPRMNTVSKEDNLCPDYLDKMVCCSPLQIKKIKTNFLAIESIFGSETGGCDLCVINLKRFWCHFTCHPEQSKFLEEFGIHNHTIGNKTIPLLDLKFHLNEEMNCNLFKSCKKTKFAAQVPAMGNAVGFTTFQGVNAYTKIAVYIEIIIEKSKDNSLFYEIDPCDTKPDANMEVRGIKIKSECTCNSCDLKCNYELGSTTPVLEGLNLLIVGLFYLFVIISTIIIFFLKRYAENKRKQNDSLAQNDPFAENNHINSSPSSKSEEDVI